MSDRPETTVDRTVLAALARVDPVALGAAFAAVGGLGVFVATLLLVLGEPPHGPRLAILAQYFIGYTVTPAGSVIGLAYGAACGFLLGWFVAALRNAIVAAYLLVVGVRSSLAAVSRTLDPD